MKVFFDTNPDSALSHFQGLTECLGITCEPVDVAEIGLLAGVAQETISNRAPAVVLDIGSLQRRHSQAQFAELVDLFNDCDVNVLLLVSERGETIDQILRTLTHEAVRGVLFEGQAGRVGFPENARTFSRELAGFSYARKPDEFLSLALSKTEDIKSIMGLDMAPSFVHVKAGRTAIFVWATNKVFDVLQPLEAEKEFELAIDEYIPAMIFLRHAFGEQCWHNPALGAGIVIDDPLLQENYGFINFSSLLESARKHKYHVTLAFIPWNHWRSSPAKARMFLEHADCFSICAHGCDHTNREFGSADYEDLLSRNFVASHRMGLHRQRTGLPSEPLMVCPQEQYSLEAMRAFADSRQFLGLVCTACMPRNLTVPQICGADLLLPAQDSFFGFPVFKRHYWTDISVFAMALFLGKPPILVEHHEFFRDGSGGAEQFVFELAKVRPGIKWTSLGETARSTHLRRRISADRMEVRFFTDDFKLEHDSERMTEYKLVKRTSSAETTLVRRVTVNGKETPFVHAGGWLTCETRAEARQVLCIRVEMTPMRPKQEYSQDIKYRAAVAFRRAMSEFRDNVIARNEFVLRAAKSLAKKMKQTSN